MIKSNNYFPRIIKENCNELDINYEFLSKDWIIKLSKDEKIRFISGYKFDLLNHASGICFDDKYATYEVLNSIGASTVKHDIIYRATNKNSYANDCKGLEYLIELFNKYKRNIVLKVNNGTCGIDVYHITNINDLKDKYNLLISKNYSLSVCPFYEIENEYRAIILNGEVKLLYKKIKPVVTGDSIKTIKELLMDFNNEYFKNYDDDNKDDVLPLNETFEYDWKFNLSKGAISSLDIDYNDKENIDNIIKLLKPIINDGFCSVDIIKTKDSNFYVMEINSGVMMQNFIKQNENGYMIAKLIYKEAIIEMFNN